MKTVLMVAAGVAVGLTVVVAVLVQIVLQFAPVLVALAVVALALRLVRRQRERRNHVLAAVPWAPQRSAPPAARGPIRASSAAALPGGGAAVEDLHLRWGPSAPEGSDMTAAIAAHGAETAVRRARAGRRPSGGVGGRRP